MRKMFWAGALSAYSGSFFGPAILHGDIVMGLIGFVFLGGSTWLYFKGRNENTGNTGN